MKKIILLAGLLLSSGSFAMSADCKIANSMFEDSGLLMVDGLTMAVNEGEKLSNTTVTYDDFSIWYNKVYSKKMVNLTKKYEKYKDTDTKNPIYLGFVAMLEVNNFTTALNSYMKSPNDADLSSLNESKSRIEKVYGRLAQDCGKKYER